MPQFENTDGSWLALAAVLGIGAASAVSGRRSPAGGSRSDVKLREVPYADYDFGETWQRGHYGPSRTLTFSDELGEHTVILSAGRRDEIDVFQSEGAPPTIVHPGSPTLTYVLTLNMDLDYVGLEVFEGDEKMGEVFLQSDWDIKGSLGPRGLDLKNKTIVQRLIPYLPY